MPMMVGGSIMQFVNIFQPSFLLGVQCLLKTTSRSVAGICGKLAYFPYISMKPFEVEFPYKSLSNVFLFPLYPCWLIYRLFGAIFFWNPRRGEMASLASFMRFDRFFRCDTTKPPAGKNVSFLKISPKVFVLHFCVKKDFWIRYFFPQKIWFEKLKNKIWMGKIVRAKIVSSVQEGEIHHDPC